MSAPIVTVMMVILAVNQATAGPKEIKVAKLIIILIMQMILKMSVMLKYYLHQMMMMINIVQIKIKNLNHTAGSKMKRRKNAPVKNTKNIVKTLPYVQSVKTNWHMK